MKIIVDIQHPAHVHYFKYFIEEMEKKGHQILVTASDKDISKILLDLYNMPYILLGSYGKGIIRKAINIPIMDYKMLRVARRFNPDLFVGFSPIRASHCSRILRKKTIGIDDTEYAIFEHVLYRPFIDIILTPACFQKDFGKKQQRFNGTTDLLYLHPNRFTPNSHVLEELNLTLDDTFFIVRFVSWDANHDIGVTGIRDKVSFIRHLEKYGRVLITSEAELPTELSHLQISISPEKIHDVMAHATLFVGESGTMATESATLGVHSVVINPEAIQDDGKYTFGVFEHLHSYGLLDAYSDERKALCRVDELLDDIAKLKAEGHKKKRELLERSDDVTEWLIRAVEEAYSESVR